MKYHKKLIFSLIISDFLISRKKEKNSIVFKQMRSSTAQVLVHALKIFCRLIRFTKNLGDGLFVFMPDMFQLDLLSSVCSFSLKKRLKKSARLLKRLFFSAEPVRLNSLASINSLYLLSLSTFFTADFRSFLLQQEVLLLFSLGFLNCLSLPVRVYSLPKTVDDFKQMIFLGIFLAKNLQFRFKKRLCL